MKKLLLLALLLVACHAKTNPPTPAAAPAGGAGPAVLAASYPPIASRVGVTPVPFDGGALGFVCLDTSGGVCSSIASAGQVRSNKSFEWEVLTSSGSANKRVLQVDSTDDLLVGDTTTAGQSYYYGCYGVTAQTAYGDAIVLANDIYLNPQGDGNTVTLSPTTSTFATSMVEGYLGLTIANCNGSPVVLSAGQSASNYLNVVTCTTGTTTTEVQSANPPTAGRVLFMRNTASATTITFGWSTGGTVSLLTGTSAIITANGTDAIKLMTGT